MSNAVIILSGDDDDDDESSEMMKDDRNAERFQSQVASRVAGGLGRRREIKVLACRGNLCDELERPTRPIDDGSNRRSKKRRGFKIFTVDSRQYNRMPRPRFLPIDPWPARDAAPSSMLGSLTGMGAGSSVSSGKRRSIGSRPAFEEEEDDPNWEYVRPTKRRRRGPADEVVKKASRKKHGRLTGQDWEVIRDGRGGGGGQRVKKACVKLSVKAVDGRKEAREWVEKVVAGVDWEVMLWETKMFSLSQHLGAVADDDLRGVTERRHNPAVRLKQYWQWVLTNSVMRMDLERGR